MQRIHLVRHGEVSNPNHVVYADLPGFNLSPIGVRQAHAAGLYLSEFPVEAVITSPLARARQTAEAVARHHSHISVTTDNGLLESGQYPAWTGQTWEAVADRHSKQLEQYLEDATLLADANESIDEIATRVIDVIEASLSTVSNVVVVGHQDPVQAARLRLTGRPLSDLRVGPPPHGSVTTLARTDDSLWTESSMWEPGELEPSEA